MSRSEEFKGATLQATCSTCGQTLTGYRHRKSGALMVGLHYTADGSKKCKGTGTPAKA